MNKSHTLSYDVYTDSIASYLKFKNNYNDDDKSNISQSHKNMIMYKIFISTIESSLTKRQFFCFWNFYIKNKSLHEIAQTLKINESTVSRHIRAARKKIRNHLKCFQKISSNFEL